MEFRTRQAVTRCKREMGCRRVRWLAAGAFIVLLTGCAVQRREKLPTAPAALRLKSATLEELLERIRIQQDGIQTLDATVEIQPTVSSALKGELVTYRDVRAFLLVRKPAFLRMIGQYPV